MLSSGLRTYATHALNQVDRVHARGGHEEAECLRRLGAACAVSAYSRTCETHALHAAPEEADAYAAAAMRACSVSAKGVYGSMRTHI